MPWFGLGWERALLEVYDRYLIFATPCVAVNALHTEFATKTIPQGAPLPTEHSKSYDSVWGWL